MHASWIHASYTVTSLPLKMKKKELLIKIPCVVKSGMVLLSKTETLCVRSEFGKSFAEK